jgi:methyltransferase
MPIQVSIAGLTLLAVLLIMGGETVLSVFNAKVLRSRGAVAPSAAAGAMWAYPVCFVAMAAEGALTGPAPPALVVAGLALFGVSKALKLWVISTLGVRWTYRVLVLPGERPITHGPYVLMRHPNYIAVIGEIAGVALIVWAPIAGLAAVIGYGALLRHKSALEDRALGRQ